MLRAWLRHRAIRLTVGLSVALASVAVTRCASATLPDKLSPEKILALYTPQLDVALKRCAAALPARFGDVIVTVMPGHDPPFELDVSRSLGRAIVPCVRARFRPILATMLARNSITYGAYASVEVGPRRARPRVDASFMRLWLREGVVGSVTSARLKARLPPEASLGEDKCLRLRGSPAFEEMVNEWLERDAKRADFGWSDVLERQFSIPQDQFLGAWVTPDRTVLLWSRTTGDSSALDPTRLCWSKLDDAAMARFSGKP